MCHEEVPDYRSVIQSDQRQWRPAPDMWRKPRIEHETSPKSSSDDSIVMNAMMNRIGALTATINITCLVNEMPNPTRLGFPNPSQSEPH